MRRFFAALFFCIFLPAAFANAAIAFVADGGYTSNSGASVTLNKPAGTAQNDLECMCVSVITNAAQGTITTPAGWTYVNSTGAADDGGGTFSNLYLFVKVAGGSEPSNYVVSYNSGGTIVAMDGNIRDYSGATTSSPVNSSAVAISGNTNVNTVPALTETFVSGEWYVACSVSRSGTIPGALPGLSHTFSNTGFLESYFLGDLIPGSSPGAETFTYAGNLNGQTAWGVSIKPLIGGPPPTSPSQLPLTGAGQ